jgi:endonuclease/exonuclease/phosphatase family metal-dependent hydrolase
MTISICRALALATIATLVGSAAEAQTTVRIATPSTQVGDARIQGGSYADTVFHREPLATKNHPSNPTYTRRSVLKFDTHNTVPSGASVQSATLTLTLSRADAETRTLGIYRLRETFDEQYATWNTRKSGTRWGTAGADLAEKWAETTVGATVGARVSFDVTRLVQGVVSGTYGSSRYTRVALVDLGSGSNTSYKEFHSSEASDAAVRPVLTVVYGGTTTSTAPAPSDPAPSTSTSTLKVLDWNTHYGVGTDGKYDIDRIATWIARFNPDIISLNEVTRYSHYNTSEDQASRYAALLTAKTGRTWYYYFRTDNGASKGVGNMVLSRFPIASTAYCQLSSRRVAVLGAVNVNGRLINFWSTHLDSSSTTNSYRIAEVRNLLSCTGNFAEQKIIAGDFNAKYSTTEIGLMTDQYIDTWAKSASDGTAYSYPGNTSFGATRNTRIDYVFASKRAGALVVRKAEVLDTRDSSGHMPSDHKPLVVTFSVQ